MNPLVMDTLTDAKQRIEWDVSIWQCFMTLKNGKLCSHNPHQYIPTNGYNPGSYMIHFCPCHML